MRPTLRNLEKYDPTNEEFVSVRFPEFIIQSRINKTTQSQIYKGNYKNKTVIIKYYENINFRSIINEFNILKKFNNKNIVKVYELYKNINGYLIIMEYIEGIDLCEFISSKNHNSYYDYNDFLIITGQLLEIIDLLHSKNIIHRDIKLENIMINTDTLEIKLIDFGFSVELINDKVLLTDFPGSELYAPPELFRGIPHFGKPRDIWSLGITIYTLLTAKILFDECTYIKKIMTHHLIDLQDVRNEFREFIFLMLNYEPNDRKNIRDIIIAFDNIKLNNKTKKSLVINN